MQEYRKGAKRGKKIQNPLTILGRNCNVLCIFMMELLFCFATQAVEIMVSSLRAADLNQVLLSSNPRRNDHPQQLEWVVTTLIW